MDGRFLIYDGFENDAKDIFKRLIETFRFEISKVSDSGIKLKNNSCLLDIYYETGLQLLIKMKNSQQKEFISDLAIKKGVDVFNELKRIRSAINDNNRKTVLFQISDFLCEHFSQEFEE